MAWVRAVGDPPCPASCPVNSQRQQPLLIALSSALPDAPRDTVTCSISSLASRRSLHRRSIDQVVEGSLHFV